MADPLSNTFNQNGLTPGFTSGVTDFDSYIATDPLKNINYMDEWFSKLGVTSGTIVYDLGASYSLRQMALWNEDASGVATVGVFACADVTCTGATSLGLFSPAANIALQAYGPQLFLFQIAPVTTEFVELELTGPGSNAGYDGLAIGEVAFDATTTTGPVSPTPEPSSLMLLGTGVASVGAVVRRRLR